MLFFIITLVHNDNRSSDSGKQRIGTNKRICDSSLGLNPVSTSITSIYWPLNAQLHHNHNNMLITRTKQAINIADKPVYRQDMNSRHGVSVSFQTLLSYY